VFRDGLLDGVRVRLTPSARPALGDRLAGLGAVLAPGDAVVVDEPPGDDLVEWSGVVWEHVRGSVDGSVGKLVLIAPPAGAPARAALENLARTLSIEWARFGIRTTCLTPGPATSDAQVADLVAYLLSPAGDYFSGCRLDLGGPAA